MTPPATAARPTEWITTRVRDRKYGSLCVVHPASQSHWPRTAIQFRAGGWPGLARHASARTAVVYRGEVGSPAIPCFFKQYRHRDAADPFKHLFRASRARRAWRNSLLCLGLGFRVPAPLCLMEARQFGFVRFCALATEAVEDAPDAGWWLGSPRAGDREWRRDFLRRLGRELGAWHRAGLYHGDPRAANLLYRERDASFHWLDCERTRRYHHLPVRRRINDLMKLNYDRHPVSRTDRMRVWKAYLESAGLTRSEARELRRRVVARTQRRWRKRGWL